MVTYLWKFHLHLPNAMSGYYHYSCELDHVGSSSSGFVCVCLLSLFLLYCITSLFVCLLSLFLLYCITSLFVCLLFLFLLYCITSLFVCLLFLFLLYCITSLFVNKRDKDIIIKVLNLLKHGHSLCHCM